jgi:hypothetical protein
MLNRLTRTLIEVLVASLIVGTILAYFGIATCDLMNAAGLSSDHLADLARTGIARALPNSMLGALVTVRSGFCFICPGRQARAGIDRIMRARACRARR